MRTYEMSHGTQPDGSTLIVEYDSDTGMAVSQRWIAARRKSSSAGAEIVGLLFRFVFDIAKALYEEIGNQRRAARLQKRGY